MNSQLPQKHPGDLDLHQDLEHPAREQYLMYNNVFKYYNMGYIRGTVDLPSLPYGPSFLWLHGLPADPEITNTANRCEQTKKEPDRGLKETNV